MPAPSFMLLPRRLFTTSSPLYATPCRCAAAPPTRHIIIYWCHVIPPLFMSRCCYAACFFSYDYWWCHHACAPLCHAFMTYALRQPLYMAPRMMRAAPLMLPLPCWCFSFIFAAAAADDDADAFRLRFLRWGGAMAQRNGNAVRANALRRLRCSLILHDTLFLRHYDWCHDYFVIFIIFDDAALLGRALRHIITRHYFDVIDFFSSSDDWCWLRFAATLSSSPLLFFLFFSSDCCFSPSDATPLMPLPLPLMPCCHCAMLDLFRLFLMPDIFDFFLFMLMIDYADFLSLSCWWCCCFADAAIAFRRQRVASLLPRHVTLTLFSCHFDTPCQRRCCCCARPPCCRWWCPLLLLSLPPLMLISPMLMPLSADTPDDFVTPLLLCLPPVWYLIFSPLSFSSRLHTFSLIHYASMPRLAAMLCRATLLDYFALMRAAHAAERCYAAIRTCVTMLLSERAIWRARFAPRCRVFRRCAFVADVTARWRGARHAELIRQRCDCHMLLIDFITLFAAITDILRLFSAAHLRGAYSRFWARLCLMRMLNITRYMLRVSLIVHHIYAAMRAA